MPAEQGYDRQLAPRAPVAQPLATPDQFGAGLGNALADVGGALHQAELRAYRLDREQTADQEAADFDHRFALVRQNAGDLSRTARSGAPPGAAGASGAACALLTSTFKRSLRVTRVLVLSCPT